MNTILIIILAASGWGSNSTLRTEYADAQACDDALAKMRIVQPPGGDKNAVTAIAYCTQDSEAVQYVKLDPKGR